MAKELKCNRCGENIYFSFQETETQPTKIDTAEEVVAEILRIVRDLTKTFIDFSDREHVTTTEEEDYNDVLRQFIDKNGLCKVCGNDHSFRPTFEGVRTSIDIIPELLSKQTKKKIFRGCLIK
jgi:hypothetical protein